MTIVTSFKQRWQRLPKKAQQWGWFVALWVLGFGTVVLMGYCIRLAMGIE